MSIMNRMIILGAPGGGKGTISAKIVKAFGFKHVSTGDILRGHVKSSSALGVEAKKYMTEGKLVPDKLVVDMLKKEVGDLGNSSILLDGFPRTLPQAKMLSEVMAIGAVISLKIPHEEIMRRISQRWIHAPSGRVYNLEYKPPKNEGLDDETGEELTQRDDDKPGFVKRRLEDYEDMTRPLVEYYQGRDTLVKEFSGTESDVIFVDVEKWLSSILKQ